jgi:hypothetical protein
LDREVGEPRVLDQADGADPRDVSDDMQGGHGGIPPDDVCSVEVDCLASVAVRHGNRAGVHLTTQKARRIEATTPDPAICPRVL